MTDSTARIDGVVAREANQAILLRRGPSKQVQLLIWDLNTDVVTPGQWLNGVIQSHDVSPDGRYLIIHASDGRTYKSAKRTHKPPPDFYAGNWTAICRPPYFTALALWFNKTSYIGGGEWLSNQDLLTDLDRCGFYMAIEPSTNIRIHDQSENYSVHITSSLNERRSWILKSHQTFREKPLRRGFLRKEQTTYGVFHSAIDENRKVIRSWNPKLSEVAWIDADQDGRFIFAENGCLWAWPNFPDGEPDLIADLNANKFEPIPPPAWALEW